MHAPQHVLRGKYAPLHAHLKSLDREEWRTSFSEVEQILGQPLPRSARKFRWWWANTNHRQSMYWAAAGWQTKKVDLAREKIAFVRAWPLAADKKRASGDYGMVLHTWNLKPTAGNPDLYMFSRENMY
ncbi:MAG: hypothetical protein OXU29_00930 [Gammaproteobacteria bacterium]|nr:hypothetical protein [Gammaproteobacteria bacterium]MDD9799021.1 hypothetical protein [Gammaproteobacteria bacterium]MDD9871050.1 hypothetical protein [Gammaproteobacteria bacterium]